MSWLSAFRPEPAAVRAVRYVSGYITVNGWRTILSQNPAE